MRDALSVLDQCLSFGEGAVTAERVREVLGLVGDELYADVLRVVTDRDPAGVFPLVARLLDAGADLAEFLGGTGEMLRSLLDAAGRRGTGGDHRVAPRGARAYRGTLTEGDVLRMLRLLAESETAVRRSGNARLAVETLLLRWTLMDRTVDLAAVIAGGPPPRPRHGRLPPRGPAAPPRGGSRAAVPAPRLPLASAPAATLAVGLNVEALLGAWETIIARGREKSSFLGAALAACRPVRVEGQTVVLELTDDNPIHREGLERGRAGVEAVLSAVAGVSATVTVASAAAESAAPPHAHHAGGSARGTAAEGPQEGPVARCRGQRARPRGARMTGRVAP